MSPLARTLLPLPLLACFLAGCDESSAFEGCVHSEDPEATSGSRRAECPPSVFPQEDLRAREVVGFVRRGEELVSGAVVRVEPTPGFAAGRSAPVTSTITDAVGFFGGLRPVALRYDLSVNLGQDVLVYRGLATRYVEPSIEGEPRVVPRAWSAKVDTRLDRPAPPGHSVAFFANGDGVFGVVGDLGTDLSVLCRTYTCPATLHALEYETSGGFEKATAYGKADVTLDAGVARLAAITLEPIPFFVEPALPVTAPAGFEPTVVEVHFGFSRTSDALLTTVPPGGSKKLPIIRNAGYTYRARATKDGAVSDTGEIGFDVLLPSTEVVLPEPPVAIAPLAGESLGAGDALVADGEGVFEHVLAPEAEGPSLRIITASPVATLPDLHVLGARAAAGPYTWSVRVYPEARFADALSGLDVRRYQPMGVSPPRSIVLR
ncbi:MAG TPA: hypothetical protein VM204_04715 [Gaiellaceae bacterium]|nr:hypothetical protein [Gaiellaceae bacterium]